MFKKLKKKKSAGCDGITQAQLAAGANTERRTRAADANQLNEA